MAPKLTALEKRKRKQERMRRYRSMTINIGDVIDNWNGLKYDLNINSDRSLADFLVQSFKRGNMPPSSTSERFLITPKTSTPSKARKSPLSNISLSTITASTSTCTDYGSATETATEGETDRQRLFCSGLRDTQLKENEISGVESENSKKRKIQIKELNTENVEKERRPRRSIPQVRISMDSSAEIIDENDPTYEPSHLEISFMHADIYHHDIEKDVDLAKEVHDIEDNDNDDELEATVLSSTEKREISLKETVTIEDVKDKKYLLSQTCLLVLLSKVQLACNVKGCKKLVKFNLSEHGSAVAVTWKCDGGHDVYNWTSQPQLINGIYLGNFQALTAITVSGNNFTKIALFCKFLGLGFPSTRSHTRVQSKYVAPAVEEYWKNLKSSIVEEHRAANIVVSGDGRMDSPGHSAKYCTYTVMNQDDKKILAMEIVDKRECHLKSGTMEAEGFRRSVRSLQEQGVVLKEIVTDAHPQISSIMKKNFPEIKHSFDMWHGAKNLGKKLMSVACSKGNEDLKPWLSDITNHFFHSADTCNGDVEVMQGKWASVLNHIVNKHEWALGQCEHGPIDDVDRDKEWISPRSQAFDSLQRVVLEPRLLKSFPYYITCQATSELESFNNHILMYAPKRSAFSFEAYKCRCFLAAIDYSKHIERETARDKKGNIRYRRKFSKSSNNWTSSVLKAPKQYSYVPDLIMDIINDYCLGCKENPLRSEIVMSDSNPGHIAQTIAPVEPPETAVLVESKKSRIKKDVSVIS